MKNKGIIWTDNPMEFAQNRIDSRQYILLPKIAEILQISSPKSILDYGCGEGYLTNHIKNKSINVGLFDISQTMSALAVQNAQKNSIKNISVYKTVNEIPASAFDSVVLSLVLMTIGNDDDYLSVLVNCKKALKEKGDLIIGITHPCFRHALYSTHHTKFSLGSEFDYFANQTPFDVYLRTSKSDRFIQFEDFHQNLTYTFSKLRIAGFVVEDLIELKDKSVENSYYNQYLSPYLILKCTQK